MCRLLQRRSRSPLGQRGQDMIEYALVTAILSVGIIAGVVLTPLGAAFTGWVGYIADNIGAPVV